MTNPLIIAEQAGKEYFRVFPNSNHAEAERAARTRYNTMFECECFVAGWNHAFWDEQARVLKESRRV